MTASKTTHSKPCTLCSKPRDVLVRCQIDETGQWHFVCPGSCWKRVSGGVIDGNKTEETKWYRYGGMWKNKHDAVSAKKPKKRAGKIEQHSDEPDAREIQCDGLAEDDASHESGHEITEEPPSSSLSAQAQPWRDDDMKYTKNDRVLYNGEIWVARKSHISVAGGRTPDQDHALWKELKTYVQDPD